ncbi:NADH-quinone oxidoreductase subunit E [Candidatus Hepatincolaceae symbiont of Richtersius coronifer]
MVNQGGSLDPKELKVSTFKFSLANEKLAQEILKKYPINERFSALMPLLSLAQKQNGGFLNEFVMQYVAKYLDITKMAVYEVAAFYSMYHLKPVGKYHIQVCNSVVCFVCGSEDLYQQCKEISQTFEEDISPDGLFSVGKVECLGACVNAPAIKVNYLFYEDVSAKGLTGLISRLKKGETLENIIASKPINVKISALLESEI